MARAGAAGAVLTLALPLAAHASAPVPAAVPGCLTTRYVSPAGDDTASGATPSTAWRTTGRVNTAPLPPGTCVLFQGGATFEGGLYLPPTDAGDAAHPVVIGSYGTGRARLSTGTGHGIFVYDTAGVTIR